MKCQDTQKYISCQAGDKGNTPPLMTPEQAKLRFAAAAADLDKEFGLDTPHQGVGGILLLALSTIFSVFRTRSWVLPLMGNIVTMAGNALHMVLGLINPTEKRRATRKKNRG